MVGCYVVVCVFLVAARVLLMVLLGCCGWLLGCCGWCLGCC